MRVENKHGLTAQLSYTWSHEIDIQSGDLGSTNISGSSGSVSNPFNLRYDRGSGVLDRRHIFSANYDYALPFFKSGAHLVEREVLGGWELSGVTVAEAGSPVNVTYSTDTLGLGGGTLNRPNLLRRHGPAERTRASVVQARMRLSAPGSSTGISPCSRASRSLRMKVRTSRFVSSHSIPQSHRVQQHRHRLHGLEIRTSHEHIRSARDAVRREVPLLANNLQKQRRRSGNCRCALFFSLREHQIIT